MKVIYRVFNSGRTSQPLMFDVESPEKAVEAYVEYMKQRQPDPEKFKISIGNHFVAEPIYVVE